MDKKEIVKVKLQIRARKANPSPPIGSILGQHGINIMNFCKKFNELTKESDDIIIPVEIKIYKNKDFDLVLKTPPTSVLIKKKINLSIEKKPGSGSKKPGKEIVGTLTQEQVLEIAKIKFIDTNCYNIESVIKLIKGTAKSMGIEII